ncbi:MAG: DUF2399 domain-containing protein [Nitrospirae bacterium]|nr:DUF2399 domain-containing protein [Nitrospirota bacterium]
MGITGLDWRELDEMLAVLLRDGAVELFEPYPRNPRKGKVVFRAGTVEKLRGILGMDAREKEAAAITSFFDSWEHPRDMDGAPLRVASVLDALEALWRSDGRAALPPVGGRVTVLKSLSNYAVILDALRGIFNLTLLGDTVSLRELSTDVAGDSKALDRVKPYLRELLGDLGGYGVDEHSSLIYCRLPVAGTVGGKAVDLSACEDYISLTVKTARAFSPVSSSMKRIILVENLTPFERLAGEPGLTEGGTGIAFLSGYPPGHVREFIKRIAHGVEALIWCDLDPDGVAIALTAAKWFKQWRPFFMDKDYLLTSRAKPLEDHDSLKLSSLKNSAGGSAFGPLLGDMERLGVKVEQEAQRVSISNLP